MLGEKKVRYWGGRTKKRLKDLKGNCGTKFSLLFHEKEYENWASNYANIYRDLITWPGQFNSIPIAEIIKSNGCTAGKK